MCRQSTISWDQIDSFYLCSLVFLPLLWVLFCFCFFPYFPPMCVFGVFFSSLFFRWEWGAISIVTGWRQWVIDHDLCSMATPTIVPYSCHRQNLIPQANISLETTKTHISHLLKQNSNICTHKHTMLYSFSLKHMPKNLFGLMSYMHSTWFTLHTYMSYFLKICFVLFHMHHVFASMLPGPWRLQL